MEALIDKNIDVEAVTSQQRNALHIAASRGHLDICRLLCDQLLIDRNARDIDGNTPLHLTSSQGHLEVIRFLISDAGVDHTVKNNFAYLAFDMAYNTDVQHLFNELISTQGHQSVRNLEENKNQYGRRTFSGVLQHNDRVSKVTSLMHKFGQIEK